MYYFAYGSNMSFDQMKLRCPTAMRIDVGFLAYHRLVFSRKGTYRSGAVASVERTMMADDIVCGVVWRLSLEDILVLDEIEDPSAYVRKTESVSLRNNGAVDCEMYVAIPDGKGLLPDEEYLRLLIKAAIDAKLPNAYVDKLLTFGH